MTTEASGFDVARLGATGEWVARQANGTNYRLTVARHGRIAAEWASGISQNERVALASVWKSVLSNVLGIAMRDGVIGSADDRVVDLYPEMMDVAPGQGPKEGRYAFPENEGITFRQLIGNTSGYMKPGESPGRAFHYQTFGMNVLSHALATAYGMYDTDEPERGAGFGELARRLIREPLGGTWEWRYENFPSPPDARLGVFGYRTDLLCTARDMAKLGQLWLQDGEWDDVPIVPQGWMRAATRTSDILLDHEPAERWRYGLGFWTNDQYGLSPALPTDLFAASGAYAADGGYRGIAVFRDHGLVVVQSPAPFWAPYDPDSSDELLRRLLDALA